MPNPKKKTVAHPGSDELDKRLLELSSLFEISQTLNSSLNLRSVLDSILLSPMGRMMINRGVILLHKEKDVFRIETLKGMPRELVGKRIEIGNLPQRPFLMEEIDRAEHDWLSFFEEFKIHLFLPIVLRNDTLGVLAFGRKLVDKPYSEGEIEFLNSLVNIAATSIQNSLVFEELKDVNYRLDKKLQEMNTLLDVGKALSSTLDYENIIKLLSYALMGQLMLNRYLIFVARDEDMGLAIQKGFEKESFDESFLAGLKDITVPCLVEDSTEGIADRWQDLDISVVVPMRSQEKTKGVIALGSRISKNEYQAEDVEFLTMLANQAMSSLENAWLFEDALEKKRMEEELAIARSIQQRLIPTEFPDLGIYDFHGINISSKQVGGDYFDIVPIDDERYGIAIADVSGKGTGASLIMSNVQASLHALIPEISRLPELVGRVNTIIRKNTDFDKFVTFFYGVLNIKDHSFSYVNAGHNPPFLLRADGTLELLEKGGLILGMMDFLYECDTVQLAPGDLLVMFTDGVTEAMDPDDEQFEEERLEKVIRKNQHVTSKGITEIIVAAVEEFAAGAPQSDDVTVVSLKVNKPK